MSAGDINSLLDDLATDSELQREWELNAADVSRRYDITERQRELLLDGNVDALVSEGLAERHVQQMRVSW
jgi:hypothetical protein